MHQIQRGLSLIIVFTLFIQPVFAEELLSGELIPSTETSVETPAITVPSEDPLNQSQATVTETSTPETSTVVSEETTVTEYISAFVSDLVTEEVSKGETNTIVPTPDSAYVAGEILVKYKDSKVDLMKISGRQTASLIAKTASLKKKDEMREQNISLLEITDTDTVEEKVDELEHNPNIEYAQPNYVYQPSTITPPNDVSWNNLWGLDNQGQSVNGVEGTQNADINALEAWAINEGTNAPVIVAIIDTGVAYNHDDLSLNMWDGTSCKDEGGIAIPGGCNHGYDFEDDDITPLPSYSTHGTHIAGTIAAVKNNALGITGVAPSARIMALRTSLTTDEIVKSIQFATHNGANIINASWEGPHEDLLLKSAIESFPGLFVVAAGNSAHDNDDVGGINHTYPSDFNLPNIISVAATDQHDDLAYFSNFGATSVDVGAPGTNIYSTVANETALSETFENLASNAIPDEWTKGGVGNDWGTLFFGGSNVLFNDIENEFYHSNRDTYVTSPTIPLNLDHVYMSFFTGCDTEYSSFLWSNHSWIDYMQLELSADGINFSPAIDPHTGQEFRWDEPTLDFLSGENPDSLNVEGFAYYFFPELIIPDEYHTDDFKFRIRWITDPHATYDYGCFIDDLQITELSENVDNMYSFSDGTSMATPHVAGLAALIKGYNPHLSTADVKEIILSTGDARPSLAGKTVTGMRINAENALHAAGVANSITTFTIPAQTDTTVIDETENTISLQVPFGTDVTSLVPTIAITGGVVTPASGVSQDFSSPLIYTVTGLNGSSTQDYVVTVIVAPAPPTPPVVQSPRSSSGGGGGGGSSKKKTKVSTPVSVAPLTSVGTSTPVVKQIFTLENTIGARNAEVMELQKILIAGKFLLVTPPTGYYGPLTARAVQAYQAKQGIPQTGIVDQATRAKLNGNVSTTTYDAQRAALLKVLQAKLLELIAQLKALKAQ